MLKMILLRKWIAKVQANCQQVWRLPQWVAWQFARENMLVYESPDSYWLVIDRLPMRDAKAGKNLRHRYQVVNHYQNICYLHRSKKAAIRMAKQLTYNKYKAG